MARPRSTFTTRDSRREISGFNISNSQSRFATSRSARCADHCRLPYLFRAGWLSDRIAIGPANRWRARKNAPASYLGGDDRRCIAVLDRDLRRVLLTRHRSADDEREIARIATMRWDEFRAFMAANPMRRYVL